MSSFVDQARANRVPWEEGLIGRGEILTQKRYPVPKLYARALMTTLNSLGIRRLVLVDKMGDVRPNTWIFYIAKSAIGVKTPPLKRKRNIVLKYYRALLAPSKFTPEGFTEWAMGKPGDEEKKKKPIPPHRECIIIRDEGSRLLGEEKSAPHLANMKEYLSDLWDGYIEGYNTRAYGYEGNFEIFVSMDLVSSPHFYNVLDRSFFTQGTGNRALWVVDEKIEPKKLGADFFISTGTKDEEWDKFERDTIDQLTHLAEDIGDVGGLDSEANQMWRDFKYECDMIAYKSSGKDDDLASYITKQPLNTLKLAMNYAASVNSVDDAKLLWILKEDMTRAIEDTKAYIEEWKKVFREWAGYIVEYQDHDSPKLEKRKYELAKFVKEALKFPDKLVCRKELSDSLDCPDINKIGEILELGVNKGWLSIYADMNDTHNLTPKQFDRFKPPREFISTVYQVTEKGERAVNENV